MFLANDYISTLSIIVFITGNGIVYNLVDWLLDVLIKLSITFLQFILSRRIKLLSREINHSHTIVMLRRIL